MPHDIPVGPTTSRWSFSAGFSRFLAVSLCFSTTIWAQQALTLKIRPADPIQLQQSIVEGQKQTIIIVVEDSTGAPIPQAAVSFRLPEQGPTGLFTNGLRSEIAITDSAGRATLAPVQWGDALGTVPLRVTAAKGQLRAGVILNIELMSARAAPGRMGVAGSTGTPQAAAGQAVGRRVAGGQGPASQSAAGQVADGPAANRSKPKSAAEPPQRVGVVAAPEPVAKQTVANPIALGAMIAPPKAQLPADLQTPRYEPPGFWKSKWFVLMLAGGGAVAGGYAAAKLRNRSTASAPSGFTPGSITQVPVVIGPPLITVGKP